MSDKLDEFKIKQNAVVQAEQHKKGKSLNDYLEFMGAYTSNASAANRSLALGGIGIIWLFKKPESGLVIQKNLLNFPLLLFAISLALDLLQYFFGAVAWKLFYERKYWIWKNKMKYDNNYACDIPAPNFISVPIYIFWISKILVMIIAYTLLLKYLVNIL
jgi:hypothetical protein